jgi:hypothetical protein
VRTLPLLVLVCACGTTPPELADAAVVCPLPATHASGAAGAEVVVVDTDPAPPARFENTWVVTATTPEGAPATVDEITVTGFMPAHGHALPSPPVVAMTAAGALEVSAIDLWMPGTWELRFDVAGAAGADRVTFEVCVAE